MSKPYKPYQPDQDLLLPPRLKDWLPKKHLAYFVSEVVDELDLSEIYRVYEKDWTLGGRIWLKEQNLPAAQEYLEQTLRLHDYLTAERQISEEKLATSLSQFPQIALLEAIPGIGSILAALIGSEIGDLERFASAEALVNYTGLAPSRYESGEVSIHGGITRQGPVWLRWALITAAHAATRTKSALCRRYWRLRRRKLPNVAKTAVAKSIARCVYGILKHGGEYQETRWGRRAGIEMEQEA